LTNGVVHLALSRAREQHRLLEFLIAATSNLDSSLDPAETLRHIAGTAVPELAELCVIDPLDSDGTPGQAIAAAADPQLAVEVERMRESEPPRTSIDGVLARALASGAPVIVEDPPAGGLGSD